ncbi:MAG: SMP-30/gluconolactonase/LRE family protein [Roseiarcus sp.]|jgi:sugar lactone lactonase YvrE
MIDYDPIVAGGPGRLGESPIWCPRAGRLWWVDVVQARLQSYDPRTGRHDVRQLPAGSLGCCALRAGEGLALALDRTLQAFDPATGALAMLAAFEPTMPLNRLNDGKIDRRGRFWIGTMNGQAFEPDGSLYRVGADLTIERQFNDVIIPNSIAFSPDDRVFYFSDTRRTKIWAFDFEIDEGRISNRRVFADASGHPGRPDGSTVDAEGFLWNAEIMGGRLVRYAPDGRIDRTVELPFDRPTSCAFGGDGLGILYVTSMSVGLDADQLARAPLSGGLIAIDVGVRGLPEPRFAG